MKYGLVVDDSRVIRKVARRILEDLKVVTDEAEDGVVALEACRRKMPDLILLDIGLPGLTGYEVAQALRREPRFRDTVLVAVSGYGQEQDRKLSKESGFDAHLVKPLDIDHLFLTVTPLLATRHRKYGKDGAPKRQVPPYVAA